MDKSSRILVLGESGMVGSATVRTLEAQGYCNVYSPPHRLRDASSFKDMNNLVMEFRPTYTFLAAAKVGGILANRDQIGDFLVDNLIIECNVIKALRNLHKGCLYKPKLMFLGSSCIYPKLAEQPISESSLLTGPLEPTNEGYALAKICGVKMCDFYRRQYGCDFISAMPTNLYGIGDNFHPTESHVLAGFIRKFHDAKVVGQDEVECWGSGTPFREFLYVDDLADALVFLMQNYSEEGTVNVGSGDEISISRLSLLVRDIVGYRGEIRWNMEFPDGTSRKFLDSSKIKDMGWKPKTNLDEGIRKTYQWFLGNQDRYRGSSVK